MWEKFINDWASTRSKSTGKEEIRPAKEEKESKKK